jgi:phospholipid/cholesterol/gamma-HCH transport system substrate-binding protein
VISRGTRLKVLVFLVVSLAGTAFVGLRYVGLGDRLFGGTYLVHADFATAGGIFPNASVTYRGVPVGRVDAVRLHGPVARVELLLRRGVRVPADLHAVVAQRSAVGEQYVDLRPDTDTGPYLRNGDVIATARTGTPLPVETLLTNLDALVGSINPRDLTVLIDELGTAFEGNETALRRLLDANSALLDEANRYLPQTVALIRDGQTVLATQVAQADAIRRWAAALAQFTETLRTSDPDLRRLLAAGPPAATELTGLLHGLDPAIGSLLGNLITVNGIAVRRLNGIEQILVVYPMAVAGGFTVVPGDGTAHLGLVLNLGDPPACKAGQSGCTGVRGTANAPRPGGTGPSPSPVGGATGGGSGPTAQTPGAAPDSVAAPGPATGPSVSGYDPVTGLVLGPDGLPLLFGGTGGQDRLAGPQSWKQLLLAGVSP